ncbi:MAG: hypothetical protein ACE5F8_00020 [Woeseiaceae bacterium]
MQNEKTNHRSVVCVALLALGGAEAREMQVGPELEAAAPGVLLDAQQQYLQAIEGELFDEASNATKLYISELLKDEDFDRVEWGHKLTQLGNAQHLAGEIEAAIENYGHAVDVLESETNRLSIEVVAPLLGLGEAYFESNDYRGAAQAFERAVHVQQVNGGLHSLEQAKTLDWLAEIYVTLGDFDRANAFEQSYVSIYDQNYPGKDLRKLPALFSQARMYRRTDENKDSQRSYLRIIDMIQDVDGRSSLQLLPAIYETADFMEVDKVADGIQSNARARRFLRRAIHIAEKHPDATPIDIADAYLHMGDFLATNTADTRAVMNYYSKAWDALSVDERWLDAREERFATPKLLNEEPRTIAPIMLKLMSSTAIPDSDLYARLLARFSVSEDGEAVDIELIEADPTGDLDPVMIRHVGKFIYRPAFVDGEPVPTADQSYEIRYSLPNTAELR